MLDRDILRNEPELVRRAAADKGEACLIDEWTELDSRRRDPHRGAGDGTG